MKAGFITFPTSVPVIGPRGVTYETEFSEAEGWRIEVEGPQRVVLSRMANVPENIEAVPPFSVNGFAFSASDVVEKKNVQPARNADMSVATRKAAHRKGASADPQPAEAKAKGGPKRPPVKHEVPPADGFVEDGHGGDGYGA